VNLDSVREVTAALSEHGLTPKKRWGQNFLVDGNVRRAIVDRVAAGAGEAVWEIGPGVGALTELLLDRGVALTAFEVDHGLVALLREQFGGRENFKLVAGDVLETWRARWGGAAGDPWKGSRGDPRTGAGGDLLKGAGGDPRAAAETHGGTAAARPRVILGNLPYSQAAPIIASFIEAGAIVDQFLFMVQEEVADRMVAEPSTRTYSAFTVLVQSRLSVSRRMRIQPGSFYPRPEVSSALVELRPGGEVPEIADAEMLTAVTRAVFHARRKTVVNSMVQAGLALPGRREPLSREEAVELLTGAGVDPAVRGETLSVERVVALANLAARARSRRAP
jgi:16S rRNA (adenine1518-N6/adenine1519-N6)-dimethyltransferase